MTIREIIENVKELKPCPYSEEQLTKWLSEAEGQIMLGVHLVSQADLKEYRWEENQDSVPVLELPFQRLYVL